MSNVFYMPLDSANISHYLSRGIILPSKYIGNKWIADIQSKYNKSTLLLSNKPLTNETDCSLTIVFAENELSAIKTISKNFYTYSKPLSIARIKSLNFTNKKKSETTVYNIEQGDAFIPSELISIIDKAEVINTAELSSIKFTDKEEDWTQKIYFYNKVLGSFSIMRLANRKLDYPENYFKYFSGINKEVENQIKSFSFKQDYKAYLNISDKKAKAYENIDIKFVSDFAKKNEKFDLPVKRGVIQFDKIDKTKQSYIFLILATYGNDVGKIKKISDFISALIDEKFDIESQEKLCLTFGINQGYAAFRNSYEIEDITINTKFELNSEVDYTIIESVYQYVFNNKKDNTNFPYITEWCPKFDNNIDLNKFETFRIFDKDIIYKKKAALGSPEYLQKLFQLFLQDSLLIPLFNLFKKDVENTIQSIIKSIYKKIKADVELNEKQKNQTKEEENKELVVKLEKELSDLKEENKGNKELVVKKEKELSDLKIENKELAVKLEKLPSTDKSLNKEASLNSLLDNNQTNNRKERLEKIKGIGELKGIAKYIGVKNFSKFKNNDEDKAILRSLIIKQEKQLKNN